MDISVIDKKGKHSSVKKISDVVFNREYSEALVHQIVTAFRANARGGNRAQKNRSSVKFSTRKPWKQKGRGVNICQMLSDPERFGYTKKEVRAMALSRAVKARRKIPEGRCVGKRVAQMEGHHYCQEMNNWDDNYKCHEKSGNCVKIIKPRIKKAINDKLRSYRYKL